MHIQSMVWDTSMYWLELVSRANDGWMDWMIWHWCLFPTNIPSWHYGLVFSTVPFIDCSDWYGSDNQSLIFLEFIKFLQLFFEFPPQKGIWSLAQGVNYHFGRISITLCLRFVLWLLLSNCQVWDMVSQPLFVFLFFINQFYRHSSGRLQMLFYAHFEDVLVNGLDMQILHSTILSNNIKKVRNIPILKCTF